MSRLRLLAGALTAALLLGGCSATSREADSVQDEAQDLAEADPVRIERYVALGDSFTAGPLVPTTDVAGGCFRSDGNYPALLADQLDIAELVDVSCSGARTRDLTHPQPTVNGATVPPQLRAVDRRTDLVTLGIGGNDFKLFSTLVGTCTRTGREQPTGSPCADRLESRGIDLLTRAEAISTNVERAVRRIQRRAPSATIVLVGYLRLVPPEGRCHALPFAPGDYAYGQRVSRALNDAIERAAQRTAVEFVDAYAASDGHDVCSEEPWVNGAVTQQDGALAYHPFASGMQAVADQLVEVLSE